MLGSKSDIKTHPDYVPSIFRSSKSLQEKMRCAKCCLERYERAERRRHIKSDQKGNEVLLEFGNGESMNEDANTFQDPLEELVLQQPVDATFRLVPKLI